MPPVRKPPPAAPTCCTTWARQPDTRVALLAQLGVGWMIRFNPF